MENEPGSGLYMHQITSHTVFLEIIYVGGLGCIQRYLADVWLV